LSRDNIGEKHVRYLSRIKDMDARTRLAKQAAEDGWTVKATEQRVAKVLAKAANGARKSTEKAAPTHQYDYNGFHCALVGDEVVISGRNFKRTRDLVRQFVAEYQSALECFLRDLDTGPAERPAAPTTHSEDSASPKETGVNTASAEVVPPVDIATNEVAADLMKQAAEVEAATQPLKDLFSEIAKAVGSPGSAKAKETGSAGLSDLLSFFNKPKSPG
jgi:hypothetical protein